MREVGQAQLHNGWKGAAMASGNGQKGQGKGGADNI